MEPSSVFVELDKHGENVYFHSKVGSIHRQRVISGEKYLEISKREVEDHSASTAQMEGLHVEERQHRAEKSIFLLTPSVHLMNPWVYHLAPFSVTEKQNHEQKKQLISFSSGRAEVVTVHSRQTRPKKGGKVVEKSGWVGVPFVFPPPGSFPFPHGKETNHPTTWTELRLPSSDFFGRNVGCWWLPTPSANGRNAHHKFPALCFCTGALVLECRQRQVDLL
mmetsp:Transcript_8791/g.23781  ORF Transcript_8791/g.23781 Transcript_8791/m.23781 type:complete len:221 (-) Transcript_8791:2789-3451(-)